MKKEWQLFYHDGSYILDGEVCGDRRCHVCVEELKFSTDGTIMPITLTEEGWTAN